MLWGAGCRQVTLQLLNPTGAVETTVVSKRAWAAVPGAYAMARRAEWGGLWPWPTPTTDPEAAVEAAAAAAAAAAGTRE